MKNRAKYVFLAGSAALIAILLYFGFTGSTNQKTALAPEKVPSRLIEAGPYGEDVETTEQIGVYTVNFKAKTLYFKKTKTLGFDNALFKKLVAKELNITILNDDKKVISFLKEHQELPLDMKVIQLDSPEVISPEGGPPSGISRSNEIKPEKIRIDKIKKIISFIYKDKVDVWDLGNLKGYPGS